MALESLRARDRRIAGRRRDTDEKTPAPAGQGALEKSIREAASGGRSRLDIFGRTQAPATKPQEDDDDEAT